MRANHSGENLHSRVSIYMCKGHLNILRHPRNSGTEKDKFCPFLINTAPDELQIIKRCLHACPKDLLHFPISEIACVISNHRLNFSHRQERKLRDR